MVWRGGEMVDDLVPSFPLFPLLLLPLTGTDDAVVPLDSDEKKLYLDVVRTTFARIIRHMTSIHSVT